MFPKKVKEMTPAQVLYDKRFNKATDKISLLITLLDKHRDAQLAAPTYWQRASDLGRLNTDLDNIIRYIK